MKKIICFALCVFSLNALEIDILSDFGINGLPAQLLNVKKEFDVHETETPDYFQKHSPNRPELAKIIVFNTSFDQKIISTLPKEKLVLFVWEPVTLAPSFYDAYARVYTWDDSLADNKKFFRFNNPYLMPFKQNSIRFEYKKLCAMVVGNWTKERRKILQFFRKKHPHQLACYGKPPRSKKSAPLYKGRIPGTHSGDEKISTLANYRFCICFENTTNAQGYITEKIFSCLAAGSIPIYWGATNIEKYIPKTCFIDYRDFKNNDEMYEFISKMSSEKHQQYVETIKQFLASDQAKIFSPEFFDNLVYEAIQTS